MGGEGVRQAVEQELPLAAVVGLRLAEGGELAAVTELIEPAPPPGPVVEDAVEIGAGHDPPPAALGSHPAQLGISAEGLAGQAVRPVERVAATAMQLEPLDLQGVERQGGGLPGVALQGCGAGGNVVSACTAY